MSADGIALDLMPLAGPPRPEPEAAPATEPQATDAEPRANANAADSDTIVRRRLRPLARFAQGEESPSFYLSLSDLMCLLLVFFVLIYSLSGHEKPTDQPGPAQQAAVEIAEPAEPAQIASAPAAPGLPNAQAAPDDLSRAALALASAGQSDPALADQPAPQPTPEPQPVDRGVTLDRALLTMVSASTATPADAVATEENSLDSLLDQLRAAAGEGMPGAAGQPAEGLQITSAEGRLVIRLPENITFDLGQALLKPVMAETLGRLAPVVLRNPQCQVIVTGHTDDLPISTAQFASNWELSAARAAAVARALTAHGVPAGRLHIRGMADQSPLLPNDSPENRQQNRRVEIELRAIG
ncbi:OmpA/MotB domain protein [Desulfarculus baarsii DSM 2075]|uniref:OmpA/MotB domain protein n=1 Tax=Desulfarculus baarsii (strain ATCC 33931 / DSM 2075 / LMG 7858 / VKM B-1802 / 2st14) TaxID=644282 RepID=E1QDT6_DESB2|nr:OmpA family protein [Desulfarculus baarsii]ADK83722.1 OmpA/MotB domain protein [Desulfarculus baarsii DSM 2075]